jgi:hypothetical protein
LQELLANPAVQGGVAPLAVALVLALALRPLKLEGLSLVAAFVCSVYLVSGLDFAPLTSTRKVVLLSIAAPALGLLVDFAFKPTRVGALVIALAAAAGALWSFWPVLSHKHGSEPLLFGASAALALAFLGGFALLKLADDSVRAGAAALALGLGSGISSVLSASVLYGTYGVALAAGAGGFLLPQMVLGRKCQGGATFALTFAIAGGLIAAGAMTLAQLPWYCVLVLALVPVGAILPTPRSAPVWLQAVIVSIYSFLIAGAACALAWPSSQQT